MTLSGNGELARMVGGLLLLGAVLGCREARRVEEAPGAYAAFVRTLIDSDRMARLDTPQSELVDSRDPTGGNDDFNNFAGKEGTNWAVLADLSGPGYVSRFWTTGGASANQRLQFYFDGERKPRIDATVAELRSGQAPFIVPLSRYEQSCWYSFVPLTYRKRLRILAQTENFTHTGWPRLFFQINHCRLPDGTDVPAFPATPSSDDVAALKEFGDFFEGSALLPETAMTNGGDHVVIPPGGEAAVLSLSGSGIVRQFVSHVEPATGSAGLILRIAWDGLPGASVAVPFDAFFGQLWRSPAFTCAFVDTSDALSRCNLPMPFRAGAVFSVSNAGPQAVAVTAGAAVAPSGPADLGYLHAVWHRSGTEARGKPHTILRAEGRGKVVGCLMGINSADPSWWALEGDESIRVDDEAVPGWLGTGLEDYFSGAWYYKNNLVRPQHGLIFKRPFTTVQYRFHRDDARHFQRAAEMVFERGPDQMSPASFASVGYYYLDTPTAAASDALDGTSAERPADQYEDAAIMGTLCNFERLGDYAGASACIERFLQGREVPFADLLRLRQIAYRERLKGYDAARPQYEEFLRGTTNEPAASYAKLLMWFHEDPSHALLGMNCGVPTRATLDSTTVGEVGHPQAFVIVPLTLAPGPHVLSLQAFRGPQPEWVQAGLRTHGGLIGTDPAWQYAFDPTGNWRAPGFSGTGWAPTSDSVQEGPPPLPYIATSPHPFVDIQSIPWGIWANAAWPDGGRTVGFRKEFNVP